MKIFFFVPGKPRGKGRPRFFRGHAVTDSQTREYERKVMCKSEAAMQSLKSDIDVFLWQKLRKKGCRVVINAFFAVPKSYTKVKREAALNGLIHPSKPDADNIIKSILDGMNSVVYEDDVSVYDVCCTKEYSDTLEGVSVTVEWDD